jgi:hypothetical protein
MLKLAALRINIHQLQEFSSWYVLFLRREKEAFFFKKKKIWQKPFEDNKYLTKFVFFTNIFFERY